MAELGRLRAAAILVVFSAGFVCAAQETPSPPRTSPIRYEMRVELDHDAKMLRGEEEIIWRNETQDEVPDMWLHLYWNAFKNEKSAVFEESSSEAAPGIKVEKGGWGWIDITRIALADGTDLNPTLEFLTPDEPDHPEDQTVARIRFPAALKPGEEIRLRLAFEAKIPRGILRTGYYQDNYFIAQWFPKPGVYEEGRGWNCHQYHLSSEFFADFADFLVHITVPSPFVIGASGSQISSVSAADGKTVTYTFAQERIHDFAWTADPDFIKVERDFLADREVTNAEYTEIAGLLHLPVEEVVLPDVKMILLIAPEHRAQVERHFKALRTAIKYYGLWYGPYPYRTVTMVDPPFRTDSGGMEYPTLFTAGTGVMRDDKVLSPEGVIIHEFGHGYWYGLAANNEFEEAWLDEGINSYSTGKVLAKGYGRGMFSASLFGFPLSRIFKFPVYYDYELDRAGAIMTTKLDPVTTHSWKFANRMSYALNVYQRASICLHTLERLLGEERMLRVMRTFQSRFRFEHPRTRDFITVVNEVSGQNMTWFFEEFFFSTLNFDYGVGSLRSVQKKEDHLGVYDKDGKKEEVTPEEATRWEKKRAKADRELKEHKTYLTTVMLRRFGEARLRGGARVKLRVLFEDGSEEVRFWDGRERWKSFPFEKPSRARLAEIDPELIWLIDSNLANNSLKDGPERGGVLRLTAKLLFWIQNGLHFLSALS
jgi:hypothetical protein